MATRLAPRRAPGLGPPLLLAVLSCAVVVAPAERASALRHAAAVASSRAAGAGAEGPKAASAPRRVLPPAAATALRRAFADAAPAWRLHSLRVEGDYVTGHVEPTAGPVLAIRLDDPVAGCTGRLAGGFCLHLARLDGTAEQASRDGPLDAAVAPAAIDALVAALQRHVASPYVVVTPKRAPTTHGERHVSRPTTPETVQAAGGGAGRGAGVGGAGGGGAEGFAAADSQEKGRRRQQMQARPEPVFDVADLAAALALGLGGVVGALWGWGRRGGEDAGASGAG